MFCYDHGHPGGDEGVGHASEPAELVNQIEALQSQINKMRPALEALQAEYDVAKEAQRSSLPSAAASATCCCADGHAPGKLVLSCAITVSTGASSRHTRTSSCGAFVNLFSAIGLAHF